LAGHSIHAAAANATTRAVVAKVLIGDRTVSCFGSSVRNLKRHDDPGVRLRVVVAASRS
jgi:hypothetical protein